MAAATGAAAALALAIASGRQGWGAGLLAGPIASTIAAAGSLVMLAVINSGHLPAEKIVETFTEELALGWVLTVAVAVLPLTFALARPPSITALVLTALLTSGAATAAIALMRDTVLPPVMTLAAADPISEPSAMAPNPLHGGRIRPLGTTEQSTRIARQQKESTT